MSWKAEANSGGVDLKETKRKLRTLFIVLDHEGAYRRVDETNGPLAYSKLGIVDHREDRSNYWSRTRRSVGAVESTIYRLENETEYKITTPSLSHTPQLNLPHWRRYPGMCETETFY